MMRFNSIRLKVIMFVLLMAVPIVLLGIGGTVYYQGIIKQNVWNDELAMAKTLSTMTPEYMNSSQLYLKSIADRPLVIKAMEDNDTPFLHSMADYADETKRVNSAYFTDSKGMVVESTRDISSMIGSNVMDRSYVGDVFRTGDPVIGDAEPGYDRMPVVPIGLPIKSENGTILGVMVGTVDLNEYSKSIRQTAVKDQQTVYMVNRTGHIMIHNDPKYMNTMENFSSVPSVQYILRGETGVNEYYNPVENDNRLGAYTTIEPMGWGVVVGMPTSIAYQPVWNATYLFAGGAAILTLAAMVLGLFFGNGIASPILRLSSATKKISDNSDYTGLLPLERNDELGELARSFKGMVEDLQNKHEELEVQAEELEVQNEEIIENNRELEKEILERREAEKAIKKSQAILAKSQQVAHVGNLALEIKTNRINWSDEGFRIFGYKPGELQPTLDLLLSRAYSDDRAILQKSISAAISENKRYSIDFRVVMHDGSIRYINFVADRLKKDTDNNPEWLYGILQDITERKQAVEAKLENAYNRSLIEASLDPLVTISPEGLITDVNKATETFTGYPRDSLVGTDFSDYFTEPEKAKEGYLTVFKEGSVMDYPLEIRRSDGHITPVMYNASVYKDEAGKVIGVFAAARDITERKRAEEAVRHANAYNRSLIEASMDPLVTIAPDGKITDVNIAAEIITGYPRILLIGNDFSNYFTDPAKAREGYLEAFEKGSVKDYPLEIRNKNGGITPVIYNASVYRDESGSVIGVFAAARDITERKRAEEAVRLANAYNRSLIEASLDPLVTISPDGKVTDVNEATENVTGYQRADLIGKDFSDYFTSQEKAQEGYQQVFKEGVVTDYPLEIRHRDGHITPVIYNASLYRDEAGRVIGVFAAARDVTELNKAEEALKQKMAEVERSNAELEQFAYVASHDLQEPLRVVASYVKLLDRRYKDKLDSDAGVFINYAVEGSMRMQQMINDLLAFSRVGTKGKPFEPTDLESIFKRVLGNLSISIRDSNATVTHDQLPAVAADDLQMTQLLQNLVSNGIKFRSADRSPVIHVSAKKLENFWEFSVSDNGVGIEPEYYDRIFIIFQRLHTKDEYPGSGIGLAICKKIVERHGGRIWVDSSPGEGSTFHFTLPIRQ